MNGVMGGGVSGLVGLVQKSVEEVSELGNGGGVSGVKALVQTYIGEVNELGNGGWG